VTEPNLPEQSSDELEVGWGDDLAHDAEERGDDDRLRDDRPPHYDQH
jgi:hypothetical protein